MGEGIAESGGSGGGVRWRARSSAGLLVDAASMGQRVAWGGLAWLWPLIQYGEIGSNLR